MTFDQASACFELAARIVVLAATNIAACVVALYVFAQHSHRKQQYASTALLCASYVGKGPFHALATSSNHAQVSMLLQTGGLVAACSYGLGTDVNILTRESARKEEKVNRCEPSFR